MRNEVELCKTVIAALSVNQTNFPKQIFTLKIKIYFGNRSGRKRKKFRYDNTF